MNLRKIASLASVALLALALVSCSTMRRAGKDLGVTALSPAIILYGGFTDGYAHSQEITNGLGGSGATQVIALPFTTAFGLVKHTWWVVIHVADFVVFPIYGAADLHPYGPEIEPLDYYTGTIFDRTASGTDADSGQDR